MGFIKKHLFLILCGLGFLIGIVLFIPVVMAGKANEKLRSQIENKVKGVNSLQSKSRELNISNVEALEVIAKQTQQASEQIENMTLLSSNRPLLYNEVFPIIPELSHRQFYYEKFADAYLKHTEGLIEKLNAREKPSYEEEEQIIMEYRNINIPEEQRTGTRNLGAPGAGMGMMPGGGMGMPGGDMGMMGGDMMPGAGMMAPGAPAQTTRKKRRSSSDTLNQEERLIQDLRKRRAQEVTMYGSTDALVGYEYWGVKDFGSQKFDSLQTNSWFSQLAAWINEDVIDSIMQLNDASQNVLESPIKRLIELSYIGDDAQPGAVVMGPIVGMDMGGDSKRRGEQETIAGRREPANRYKLPYYVIEEEGEFLGDMTSSFTRRASNELYDVVHFELAVVMKTDRIDDFVTALQGKKSSQYTYEDGTTVTLERVPITVVQYHIEPLNIELEREAGYYYGEGSLAVFRMIGEYVFYKTIEGYENLKPDPVIKLFEKKD